MQFPRSKRFTESVDPDIPPVGSYDPNMPEAKYKRGAMLEKAGRFIEKETGPDVFGVYAESKENTRPRPRASSAMGMNAGGAERARQQMDDFKNRLQLQHEKDLAKLLAKITRLEASRDELVREKGETSKEMLGLKAEVRSLTSRETAISAKLGKAEASLSKYTTNLPVLQGKLDELSKSHAESKKRKDAELVDLRATLASRDEWILELQLDVKRYKEKAREEARGRRDVFGAAEESITSLKKEVGQVRVAELHAAQLRILRLERQLGDRTAQVQALGEYSEQVGEEADFVKAELARAEQDRDWALEELRRDREERKGDKEWRQRTRSDQRELNGLRDEVSFLEGWRTLDRQVERESRWLATELRGALESEQQRMQKELEVSEGELDLAVNEEIPRLEEELRAASEERDEIRERVHEMHEALEVAEKNVAELQTRAVEEVERYEGQLEEQKRLYGEKEKEVVKERADKKRVANLLNQSRLAQDGLREELDAALAELARVEGVQSQHKDLCRTIDQLARMNAATEQDNKQLAEQNTELISHGNPHQKIRHVAQIREELAESRRRHLSTTSTLASAESENAALRAELDAYRSVSTFPTSSAPSTLMGPPSTIPARSRVSRPAADDVYTPAVSARPNFGASRSVSMASSTREVPRFVISDQHTEDEDRLFASTSAEEGRNGLSALQASSTGFLSHSMASSTGGRRAGRASQVHGAPSSPAIRMQGVMTTAELFD